jgi:hypothetical protein
MPGTSGLKLSAALICAALGFGATANAATQTEVSWATIVGNPIPSISTSTTTNTIGGIFAGTDPWSTSGGSVQVDLTDSAVTFTVTNLVFGAESVIGTPGPVTKIKGTLVCGPGSGKPVVIDTPNVDLSAQGDAKFSGFFKSSTAACSPTNVAFLIRNVNNNRWIAYGAGRNP